MLTHLTIKNYALIKHLEFAPSATLNVITGETGAGKSILLGAIGLLLGNRADSKTLWDEKEKCVAEGIFEISRYGLTQVFESENLDYEAQTVIRREVSPSGKSRAFINDTPVTLDVMRRIGSRLMDIHSQHETLELGNKLFQLTLVDSFAGNNALKEIYSDCWKHYCETQQIFEQLHVESTALKNEADFVSFQLEELVKADLKEGELEKLESELKIQEHAEEIKTQFNSILEQLGRSDYSVTSALSTIRTQLQTIATYSKDYQNLFQRMESARLELADILQEIEQAEETIEFEPVRAEQLRERVSLLYQLQHKHRLQDVSQLISLRDTLQHKADKTSNLDELLNQARQAVEQAEKELTKAGKNLSQSRQKTFTPLAKQITLLLKELGIPNAVLSVDHSLITPGVRGMDAIEILFSANKGVAPQPLAQVASGGEFSRVMFSIKYVMAEKANLPTLILDEIDSGVSGEIAIQLGNRMKEIAGRHQIIAISHLPQIAAKADAHFFVYKDNREARSMTAIKRLSESERVTEIAQMIGGSNPSPLTLENAREMIR
ncbi:MAG: DNA repair protein RecN [Cyclobacteriaceae bacterium]|nr:DNA repair protein RecN [Cyclobacteriaceae bacterium]